MPETPTTIQALYRARPTVRINGQEYAKVRELVVSMAMNEQEGGLSALELRLTNVASDVSGGADLAFEDDKILRLGRPSPFTAATKQPRRKSSVA